MAVDAQQKKATVYEAALGELLGAKEPAWLSDLRQQSLRAFTDQGFPTVAHEDWKYTNVATVAKTTFAPIISPNGTALSRAALAPFIYEETRGSIFVFVNGIFRRDLSSIDALPREVIAIELQQALSNTEHEPLIRQALTAESETDQNSFALLNTALFAGGIFIRIPRGVELEVPIHLQFISEAAPAKAQPASFPRVIVAGEANSSATIIESYRANDDEGAYFTNAVVDISLQHGARCHHYKLQRESQRATHVANTRAALGPQAVYDTTTINLGAALSRHDISVTMDDEGASCAVDGLYMVDGGQHTDTHSVIDHRRAHCSSHQLYKGILDGKSRAVFNGKVFVRHGAQKTDAQQTNKNLLLSDEAHVDTKPQLEIFADDVKCAHGAAVGQLSEDEMFYLESRGINPALAKNMLTYGFAEEVIAKIPFDSIKRELDEAVLNRLHSEFKIEA